MGTSGLSVRRPSSRSRSWIRLGRGYTSRRFRRDCMPCERAKRRHWQRGGPTTLIAIYGQPSRVHIQEPKFKALKLRPLQVPPLSHGAVAGRAQSSACYRSAGPRWVTVRRVGARIGFTATLRKCYTWMAHTHDWRLRCHNTRQEGRCASPSVTCSAI